MQSILIRRCSGGNAGRGGEGGNFLPGGGGKIPLDKVAAFYRSEPGMELQLDQSGKRMIVQGVTDCDFREGDDWIVADDKTDRMTEEEGFAEKYCPQLLRYARAPEGLTGIPVRECRLYFLH